MRISRDKAVQEGYTIDDSVYPPVAYKGDRFGDGVAITDYKQTFTPLEHELMGLAFISMQALWRVYLTDPVQPNAHAAKRAYDTYRHLIMNLTGVDPDAP
jgi:hypothetical protein